MFNLWVGTTDLLMLAVEILLILQKYLVGAASRGSPLRTFCFHLGSLMFRLLGNQIHSRERAFLRSPEAQLVLMATNCNHASVVAKVS